MVVVIESVTRGLSQPTPFPHIKNISISIAVGSAVWYDVMNVFKKVKF